MIFNILWFIFGFVIGFFTCYISIFFVIRKKIKEISKRAFLNLDNILKELEKFKKYNNR